MRFIKILLAVLLAGVSVFISSCSSKPAAVASDVQTATASVGNIRNEITATGNLALSTKDDLAFEVGGTYNGQDITVDEVLVDEGDMVKKGQVLAKLDTVVWQDYLDTLQKAVTTAQRVQTTKQRALTSADRAAIAAKSALQVAQDLIPDKDLALKQAQLNLQTAQYNLSQIPYVKIAQHNVDVAQAQLTQAQAALVQATTTYQGDSQLTYTFNNTAITSSVDTLRIGVIEAQRTLAQAKTDLNDTISNSNVKFSADVATDIKTKELAVQQAQRAVENAATAINNQLKAVNDAKNSVDDTANAAKDAIDLLYDATNNLSDAQKTLADNKAKKTEVVAPYDGFITKVNVKGGDKATKGLIACTIADPNKFESDVNVSEMDISKVKLDGSATVSMDSLGGLIFPAKVTHIAPTATISQNVVNFKVNIELQSTTPLQSGGRTTFTFRSGTGGTGAGSAANRGTTSAGTGAPNPAQAQERLNQAVQSGQMTQQQADQLRQRFAQGGTSDASGAGASAATTAPSVTLREGLTVTVNILVSQKDNVLLIPTRFITRQGAQATVEVKKADGTTEVRSITTGASDPTNTEVVSGLSEGETIVLKKTATTTTTSTTTNQSRTGPMIFPAPPPGR